MQNGRNLFLSNVGKSVHGKRTSNSNHRLWLGSHRFECIIFLIDLPPLPAMQETGKT